MSDYRAGDSRRNEERLDKRIKQRGEMRDQDRSLIQRQALLDHESFGVDPYNGNVKLEPQGDPDFLDLLKRRLLEQQPQPSEPKFMPVQPGSLAEKIRSLFV